MLIGQASGYLQSGSSWLLKANTTEEMPWRTQGCPPIPYYPHPEYVKAHVKVFSYANKDIAPRVLKLKLAALKQ